jgi:hypothetical protein
MGGHPRYKAVAAAGKLRDGPSIVFDGASWLQTDNDIPGITGPTTILAIFKLTDGTVINRVIDGRNTFCGFEYFPGSPPTIFIYGGASASLPAPYNSVNVNDWNYLDLAMHTASPASAAINGNPSNAPTSTGSGVATGLTIGAWHDGSNPLRGELADVMMWDGDTVAGDPTLMKDWIQYHHGRGFPQ